MNPHTFVSSLLVLKKFKRSAIAIGNFDGLHKGHQKVFRNAKNLAKKNKIKFGVLTSVKALLNT